MLSSAAHTIASAFVSLVAGPETPPRTASPAHPSTKSMNPPTSEAVSDLETAPSHSGISVASEQAAKGHRDPTQSRSSNTRRADERRDASAEPRAMSVASEQAKSREARPAPSTTDRAVERHNRAMGTASGNPADASPAPTAERPVEHAPSTAGAQAAVIQRGARRGAAEGALPGRGEPAMEASLSRSDFDKFRAEYAQLQKRIVELERTNKQLTHDLEVSNAAAADAALPRSAVNLVSVGDVRRKMDELAAEVIQLAATLADPETRVAARAKGQTTQPDMSWRDIIISVLGEPLASVLADRSCVSETLVDMGAQSVAAFWCFRAVNSWCFAFDDTLDETFNRLLNAVRDVEEQNDASLWRSITRRGLQKASAVDSPQRRVVLEQMLAAMLGLFSHSFPIATLQELAGGRIAAVCDAAFTLHRMIGTQILSEELATYYVHSNAAFDPDTMEDVLTERSRRKKRGGGGGKPGPDIVVCTTGLGLSKRGPQGESFVIVKATVLLRSGVKELCRNA